MSTTGGARKENDDEPEEGEIQDDEGSLEDVSSDDEIFVKRKELCAYSRNYIAVRSPFTKTDSQFMQPSRRHRFRSSKLKTNLTRVNSGFRVTGVQDNYHESMQRRRRSSKEYCQKGKIHEKENKAKDSKKAYGRCMPYYGNGSELRSTYNISEHSESQFASATSSKGPCHKSEIKEKRKSSKGKKFCNPLGEVCESQLKTGNESCSVDKLLRCDKNIGGCTIPQKENEGKRQKPELSPSSESSDIQVLDVPAVIPEIITICDSDDESVLKEKADNYICMKEESNKLQLSSESRRSFEQEDLEKSKAEDSEDNLNFLREAALKSSKPEVCPNPNPDDEVLQLRLAALRSAIIRKCEERKKRGLTLSKTSKTTGNKQMMSISPLGSPNNYYSGDSSFHGSDEVDCDINPFDSNVSSKQQGVSDSVNDSEVDKITTIDMELAESDEEREIAFIGAEDVSGRETVCEKTASNSVNPCKIDSVSFKQQLYETNDKVIYPVVDPVVTQSCSTSNVAFPICGQSAGADHIPTALAGTSHIHGPSEVGHVHISSDGAGYVDFSSGGAGGLQSNEVGLIHTLSDGVHYLDTSTGGVDHIHTSDGADIIHTPSIKHAYHTCSLSGEVSHLQAAVNVVCRIQSPRGEPCPIIASSAGAGHVRAPCGGTNDLHESCEGGCCIYGDGGMCPTQCSLSDGTCHLQFSSDGACYSRASISGTHHTGDQSGGCSRTRDPSDGVSLIYTPSGYIIGDEEQSSSFETVVKSHVTPLQRQWFSLESKKHAVQNEKDIQSGESDGKTLPGVVSYSSNSNNSNSEQTHVLVSDVTETCDNSNSQSFEPSENGVTYNICNAVSSCEKNLVHVLSPMSKELDLDSMIVIDEIGKSSDDCQWSSDDSQCFSEQDIANVGKCFAQRKDCEENMLNVTCNAVSSDLVLENSDKLRSSDLVGKDNKEIPNDISKLISAACHDSSEKPKVSIYEFNREVEKTADEELKAISTYNQDSNSKFSYTNSDETIRHGDKEVTNRALNTTSENSEPSHVNINESIDQKDEDSYKHPVNVVSANTRDSSDGFLNVYIDESTRQENEGYSNHAAKIISAYSMDSSDITSNVNVDKSTCEKNEVFDQEERIISTDLGDASDKLSHANIGGSSNPEIKIFNHAEEVNSKNFQDSSYKSSRNIDEFMRKEVCNKYNTIFMCDSADVFNAQNISKMSQTKSHEIVGTSNVPKNLVKFSEENELFLDISTDVEKHNCKSILQCELPVCEESGMCFAKDTEDQQGLQQRKDFNSSANEFQKKEPTFITNCTFDSKEVEIVNDKDNVEEDETQMLRMSLLAMLKGSQKDNKLKTHDLSDSQSSDSSIVKNVHVAENVHSCPLQSNLCTENVLSIDSSKCDSDSYTLVKQFPQSVCATTVSHNNFIQLPQSVYPLRNSSLNKQGKKNNKHGDHEAKVPGRFNINVPKLVIKLGEDSDSGEDDESDPSKSDFTTQCIESVSSEEPRDTCDLQSVPPDFEKKLDLLLKRARFQQEVPGKDIKEFLNQRGNLPKSCQRKVVKLKSLNLKAYMGSESEGLIVPSGSSNITPAPFANVSPLIDKGVNSVCGRNTNLRVQTSNKVFLSSNNMGVTKISAGRKADDYKKYDYNRIKKVSSSSQASSTMPSVVDIGLLPSSKQKEYIELKRQLAQLVSREREMKVNDTMLLDATILSARESSMEKVKEVASPVHRSSALKTCSETEINRSLINRKFVRRGRGITLVSRTDWGKSRRIVRALATSYNAQPVLRNQSSLSTSNKLENASQEASADVQHALCVSPKRVTSSNIVEKLSAVDQVTSANVKMNDREKRKRTSLTFNKLSVDRTKQQKELFSQMKGNRLKQDGKKVQVTGSVSINSFQNQKTNCGKNILKRKEKNSENTDSVVQKKIAVGGRFSEEQSICRHTALSHIDDNPLCRLSECSLLNNIDIRKVCVETSKGSGKRKRTVSEDGRIMRWKRLVPEIPDQNCQNSKETEIFGKRIGEDLWNTESKLISQRYQVLQDIAALQTNLCKIENVKELKLQIIGDIERLKKQVIHAEAQLNDKEEMLKVLYSEVETAKRDIMRRQSETLLLSVECEKIGCKIHGSNYSVPNTCTDLIRNGMTAISNTLQDLTIGKSLEYEASSSGLSGEIFPEGVDAATEHFKNLENHDKEEDSGKQIPHSYLSPLDAIRTTAMQNNDNQAVLCPYQMMGTCKDRECCYQH